MVGESGGEPLGIYSHIDYLRHVARSVVHFVFNNLTFVALIIQPCITQIQGVQDGISLRGCVGVIFGKLVKPLEYSGGLVIGLRISLYKTIGLVLYPHVFAELSQT
jgi:hypothetical protein